MDFAWSLSGEDVAVVRLVGELDAFAVRRHGPALSQAVGGRDVELDLGALRFIDGAGLRLLVSIADAVGGRLIVRNCHGTTRRVIALLDLEDVLVPRRWSGASVDGPNRG